MNKVSMDKKYEPKNKQFTCEIITISLNNEFPVAIKCTDKSGHQTIKQYKENGQYYFNMPSDYDLIEVSTYADFKIDDKVVVWDSASSIKLNRHFAGISDSGKPMAFAEGMTSFTADCRKTDWDNCELYKEE